MFCWIGFRFTAVDVMRAHFLTFEAMLEEEEVQVQVQLIFLHL